MPISRALYNAILKEDINANTLNNDLTNVLKEILNHDIIITYDSKKLTIHPYWIELYYYIEGNTNLQDPFCDINSLKKTNNKLYFKSSKSTNWNRNRMDICLGNSNAYISILIKRATIENNNDILTESNMLTDSEIANRVLNFCNLDNSNLTYTFSKCSNTKNILFTSRVNIYNKDKTASKRDKFAKKLYAAYDSCKFSWTSRIVD